MSFRFAREVNNEGIGNFPAKELTLAVLLEALFKKNGAAGIANEEAGSGEEDVTGTILDIDLLAEKGREARHETSFRGT